MVRSRWLPVSGGVAINLKMQTERSFADYAIALWDLPATAGQDRSRVRTSAKDFILARNTDGERHLVLFFDLEPGLEIEVTLMEPSSGGC